MTPYLYAHPNRHAPERANDIRFWGYPSRPVAPRLIGLHTTESLFDLIGEDTGAENVARYQSTTDRPSSYHRIVDRDSTVVCLPDEAVAFGIGNLNSPTLHLALAMRAVDWSDPAKHRAALPTLARAADVAADWCTAFGIPLTWLAREQAFGSSRGFIRHGTADPTRRSDPGKDFPADLFFELIADRLATGPALTKEITMLIVDDPGAAPDGNRQWICDTHTKRHSKDWNEVLGLRAVGVPHLEEQPGTVAQRAALLAARQDVTR